MFTYKFTNKARKNLRRFDRITADRIVREIKSMCSLPHPLYHRDVRKVSGYSSFYRLRIGIHIRVVFDVDKTENLIKVIEVNTKENIRY